MIKHVRIRNFKSLGDVSVTFDPVTVLIGRSGSGKTNFVNALRFVRDCLLNRYQNHMRGAEDRGRIASATSPKADIVFEIMFNVPSVEEDYQYLVTFKKGTPPGAMHFMPYEEKLLLGTRELFHKLANKWVHQPSVSTVPEPSPYSLMLSAITGIQEIAVAYLVLSSGIGCYDFSGDVLLRSKQGQRPRQQTEESGLSDSGDNFLVAFESIVKDLRHFSHWKEINTALQQLIPTLKSVQINMPEQSKIDVSHQVNSHVLPLELDQESEGFRRFFAHLIALYQSPPKQTLIFEEPEKGVHPGGLSVLADQFKACPDDGRGQVILTTHGPQLLDCFEPETIRVVEIKNYVTRISPVAPDQIESIRERLLSPGELLTGVPPRSVLATAPEG